MASFVPSNYDLRTALVFCYCLRKTAAESHRMLVKAYGKHALGKTQCFEWFKKFKSGDFHVRNEQRGRPPKKFKDNELQALLDKDDTQTQQELADQLNVTQKAISLRLKAMGKIQKMGKWVFQTTNVKNACSTIGKFDSPIKTENDDGKPRKRRKITESSPNNKRRSKHKMESELLNVYVKKEIETDDVKPSISLVNDRTEESISIKTEPMDFDESMNDSIYDSQIKIKLEETAFEERKTSDSDFEVSKNDRAEFYSFVKNDYIEYSAAGSPLNWIEGRKPPKGLPANAKPLSSRKNSDLQFRCILGDVRVTLAPNFKKTKQKSTLRMLKTLGAMILSKEDQANTTHVLHTTMEIPSTALKDYRDMPRTVRHINLSWLTATAEASKAQDIEDHVVKLAADYCNCPCRHR